MPGQEEEKILIQLAELRQQMTAVSNSVEDVKSSVKEVLSLDRSIAELAIHYQQQAKELHTQWIKIDEIRKAVGDVDRKAEEWINKGRGAWFAAVLLGSLAQVAVLAMIAWTFSHVSAAEDAVLLLNHRVSQLEQQRGK